MADLDKSITQFDLGTLAEGSLFIASDVGSGVPYESHRHPASEVADKMLGTFEYNDLQTDNKKIFGAINELADSSLSAILTGTLTAGQTFITISDSKIKEDSLLACYTDPFGINPIDATATNGSVTLTFEEQSSDVKVAVEIRGQAGGGGGGGSDEPEFTSTKICDNTSLALSLTFTDDYTNYDFLKFIIYNSSSQVYTEIITTPEMVTNAFTYSENRFNLNEFANTQYCCYQKDTNTGWTRTNNRGCDIYEVYGLTCSNLTVNKTTIYNQETHTSSEITITSATSLFDYDYLFVSTCSGDKTETQPCYDAVYPKGLFGRTSKPVLLTRYGNSGMVTLSEYQLGAWRYFFVQGITFS